MNLTADKKHELLLPEGQAAKTKLILFALFIYNCFVDILPHTPLSTE